MRAFRIAAASLLIVVIAVGAWGGVYAYNKGFSKKWRRLIMEEFDKDAWCEIVERCQEVGVDGFELNFSCPHGLPERKMGAAMGENPDILEEVSGWVMEVAKVPV